MAGKNFFQRFAAETGFIPPHQEGRMVVVAIYHNVVHEYRYVDDPKTNRWKKDLVSQGVQVATISEEHAKRIVGKRFQEQSYYHQETQD